MYADGVSVNLMEVPFGKSGKLELKSSVNFLEDEASVRTDVKHSYSLMVRSDTDTLFLALTEAQANQLLESRRFI